LGIFWRALERKMYILRQFGMICDQLVYMAFWYSLCPFGMLFPFWYVWAKKNLATFGSHQRRHSHAQRIPVTAKPEMGTKKIPQTISPTPPHPLRLFNTSRQQFQLLAAVISSCHGNGMRGGVAPGPLPPLCPV
jgi:hypothetical protein